MDVVLTQPLLYIYIERETGTVTLDMTEQSALSRLVDVFSGFVDVVRKRRREARADDETQMFKRRRLERYGDNPPETKELAPTEEIDMDLPPAFESRTLPGTSVKISHQRVPVSAETKAARAERKARGIRPRFDESDYEYTPVFDPRRTRAETEKKIRWRMEEELEHKRKVAASNLRPIRRRFMPEEEDKEPESFEVRMANARAAMGGRFADE